MLSPGTKAASVLVSLDARAAVTPSEVLKTETAASNRPLAIFRLPEDADRGGSSPRDVSCVMVLRSFGPAADGCSPRPIICFSSDVVCSPNGRRPKR
jgi:hypothetical protein